MALLLPADRRAYAETLVRRALALTGAPGQAVEVGFGDGTETLALLERGWRVLAIDPTPAAADLLLPRVPPHARPRLRIVTAPAHAVALPLLDLLYAGYSRRSCRRRSSSRSGPGFALRCVPARSSRASCSGPRTHGPRPHDEHR